MKRFLPALILLLVVLLTVVFYFLNSKSKYDSSVLAINEESYLQKRSKESNLRQSGSKIADEICSTRIGYNQLVLVTFEASYRINNQFNNIMKTKILILAIITQTIFIGCVHFTASKSSITKGITYENVEEGWEFKNNEWYYYGEKVNLSPVIYTSIETIDSTCVVNLSMKIYKTILHTQSTGFYETSEPDWKWDDTGWSCNGNHVKSFPPSFTRKISKTVVNEDLIKSKKTITIEDSYRVKDQKWVWGIKENCWLLDGNITNLLPPYMMIKSTKKEITQPYFSIKIFNSKQ